MADAYAKIIKNQKNKLKRKKQACWQAVAEPQAPPKNPQMVSK